MDDTTPLGSDDTTPLYGDTRADDAAPQNENHPTDDVQTGNVQTGNGVSTDTSAPTGSGVPTGTNVPTGDGAPAASGIPTGCGIPTGSGIPTGAGPGYQGTQMRDLHLSFRNRGLVRPRNGRLIGGVCAGLGRRFGLRPWPARALFVLILCLLPGSQILIYPILWVLMPAEAEPYEALDAATGRPMARL